MAAVKKTYVVITIDGPDAELAADEIKQRIEDVRDSREFDFYWLSEVIEEPEIQKTCTWWWRG